MFITLEGPEGAGKSSQMYPLANFLRHKGYAVVTTREPGGTTIGDQIRACLHDPMNVAMTPTAEVLLYAASRAQLVNEVIQPALKEGMVVLCDRYADSTMAYQGFGRGYDRSTLAMITALATGGLKPDLTLLLDIDVARGLARRRSEGEEMNRLDLETMEFHNRVREGYHQLAASDPERWVRIDADRPVEKVQSDLQRLVVARMRTTAGGKTASVA
jgi:dTMP kinase